MFNKFEIHGDVLLRPFDVDIFEVANDVKVRAYLDKGGVIDFTIKAGYRSDLGSIPKTLQNWFPYMGNEELTACYLTHDILYSTQSHLHEFSKEFVDDLLCEMIKKLDTKVSSWKASCIWFAVDMFGSTPWNEFDENDYHAINNELLIVKWGDK